MFDLIRESTVGELVNRFSGGRILPYPDQRPGFEIPKRYRATSSPASSSSSSVNTEKPKKTDDAPSSSAFPKDAKNTERESQEWISEAPTRVPSSDALGAHHHSSLSGDKGPITVFDERPVFNHHPHDAHGPHLEQTDTISTAAVDVEASPGALEKALEAEFEHGDYILVDWYDDEDPENPRNWSFRKRAFVLFEICLLT